MALLLLTSIAGCSQPIDPDSSVPAQLQPLVFLIAAVGLGFGIAALDHHHSNSSSGNSTNLTSPTFVGSVGNSPFDLATDPSAAGSVGALGTNGGTGGYGFTELGSSSTNAGSYALTPGYHPFGVGIDGVGDDWFDDNAGNVQSCSPPTSTPRTCAPLVSFNDGLGSGGVRALAADTTHVFIVDDNGSGTVNWAAFALDGTGKLTGSYTYTGKPIFAHDAVSAVTGTVVGTYVVFHQDGTSWTIALPGPPVLDSFTFSPVPLSSTNVAYDGTDLYYGMLGSPTTGGYQIGRYAAPGNTQGETAGSIAASITIGSNGQTSPRATQFALPVHALRTDGESIYMLDAKGNLVLFNAF
ncbi:MAG TPA: hypothetical protein VEJ41_02840 [Candidatus Acidoferrales bacterium]|nr:hypothetical protein [Candidatus Acidoferrales bacterium]